MSEQQVSVVPRKASMLRRMLRVVGVLMVFVLALTPCFAITLATQGEIVIALGSAPDQEMRFWLVMDAYQRGIGYSTPAITTTGELALCVQTNVNYALWVGRSEPTVFCDCYARADAESAWSLTSTRGDVCS